ncbi:MAG TPA: excisionase family DNA-binding protein [Chloroflexia bacterium]|nr:excisionase family DNA-binding protein [Chloroflexia bacterium]
MEKQEFLTIMAAADYLGVSRDKVNRLIRSGRLKPIENPLDGRSRLISREQLDNLLPNGQIIKTYAKPDRASA